MKSGQACIHIGLEKTGTTFLQDFLHLNRKKLAKIGFYKSTALQGRNDYRLVLLGQDKNSFSNVVNNYCKITPDSVEDSNRTLLNLMARAHKADLRFLASSELISSLVLELSEIERFKSNLDSIFTDVKILLFIRRQEQLLVSRYSTQIIHGSQQKFPSSINQVSVPPAIDQITILNRWQRVYGESLLVLPYFEGLGSTELVHHFFNSLGISTSELNEFVWPQINSNSSMSTTGLETLRRLNEVDEKIPSELRERIIEYIRKRTDDEGKFGINKPLYEQLVNKFNSVNKQVSYFLEPMDREDFLNTLPRNSNSSTGPNSVLVEELLVEIVEVFYKNDFAISRQLFA